MLISKINYTNFITKPFFQTNTLSFTAKSKSDDSGDEFIRQTIVPKNKMAFIENNLSYPGEELLNAAIKIAKTHNHAEVNQYHVALAGLKKLDQYIDDLNSGKRMYGEAYSFTIPSVFEEEITEDIFKKQEKRNAIQPIVKKGIADLDIILNEIPASKVINKKPSLAKDYINDVYSIYSQNNDGELNAGDALVHDDTLLDAALFPWNEDVKNKFSLSFVNALKDKIYIDNIPLEKRIHISFYDDKAVNIWKNLSVGTNIAILYEKNSNPYFLVNSFVDVFDKSDKGFGNLNKKNTEIVNMNNMGDIDNNYMHAKLYQLGKNETKNYVIIMDIMDKDDESIDIGEHNLEIFKNAPKNVKFVMLTDKDKYYSQHMDSDLRRYFADFGEVSMPVMNMLQAKKAFKEKSNLMSKIKKDFSTPAIDKCVEVSNQLAGNYPEKAQKVMELITAYYVDKEKISLNDVVDYVKEAKEVFKSAENNASVKILFDTEVKLKDLVGCPSTKKEAQSIVNRIKDKSIGTKGFIIYSQDGSVGAGRKYTAQAIAGEAKIPYLEINAVDFGTKDVNLFDEGNLSPEGSMRKLFSMAKAQAETNSAKSAVLFIENFEYFSVGEQVSEYHEKAMSQLIREMNKAQEQGFNIVVIGSTSNPKYIGESTSKSFKFIDLIEVESPGYNRDARCEIIDYYVKKKNIKIAGKDGAAQKEILNGLADTTKWFSFIEILTLLDKAKSVAKERNHKEIDKADFTEAYLQLTTGRPAVKTIPEHEKRIVTSHECGHALNLTIMHHLAKKQNIPWHLGEKVDFITLDPRGTFGGCVSTKDGENNEWSFEKIFSDLVCDFGGNSCEKRFYNIDGSWGITTDMQMATNMATQATALMGQGKHWGKKSLSGTWVLSEKDKDTLNQDIDVMLKNAQNVSDLITEAYEDFIKDFTERYWQKVGTGECIIPGEFFEKELSDWINKQPKTKLDELTLLDSMILDTIKACKNGKEY